MVIAATVCVFTHRHQPIANPSGRGVIAAPHLIFRAGILETITCRLKAGIVANPCTQVADVLQKAYGDEAAGSLYDKGVRR